MTCAIQPLHLLQPSQPINTILLCLPWVGGGLGSYRSFARRLVAKCPKLLVLGCSLASRAEDCEDTQSQAEWLLPQLQKFRELYCGTIMLLGHSYGGLLAYEMSRLLYEHHDWNLVSVIVSAIDSPQNLTNLNRTRIQNRQCPRYQYRDHDLIAYVRGIGGLPAGLDEIFLRRALPAIRADYQCFECYEQRIMSSSQSYKAAAPELVVIRVRDDATVSFEGMLDWEATWSSLFPQQSVNFFHYQIETGGHFYLCSDHGEEHLISIVLPMMEKLLTNASHELSPQL